MKKIIVTGEMDGQKIWREESAEETLLNALRTTKVTTETHFCTSDCNNTKDCPLCEHGKMVCVDCGDEEIISEPERQNDE